MRSPNRLLPWYLVTILALCVVTTFGYDAAIVWSTPQDLGGSINALLADQRSPQIAVDGRSLYFGSNRAGGFGGLDIYVSHRSNPHADWDPPTNMGSAVNGTANDSNAFVTDDGHELLFNSNRAGGCGGNDLYLAHRDDPQDDTAWGVPVNLGCLVNSPASDSGPALVRDPATHRYLLFFASGRAGGLGGNDFYVSHQNDDGSFGPAMLIAEISSPFDDNKLTVHPDGLDLYFSSNRPGGGSGAQGFNVWTAHRDAITETWSVPTLAVESAGLPSLAVNRRSLYVVVQQPGSNANGVPFLNDIAVSQSDRHP